MNRRCGAGETLGGLLALRDRSRAATTAGDAATGTTATAGATSDVAAGVDRFDVGGESDAERLGLAGRHAQRIAARCDAAPERGVQLGELGRGDATQVGGGAERHRPVDVDHFIVLGRVGRGLEAVVLGGARDLHRGQELRHVGGGFAGKVATLAHVPEVLDVLLLSEDAGDAVLAAIVSRE